jgi:hypothetical protein
VFVSVFCRQISFHSTQGNVFVSVWCRQSPY